MENESPKLLETTGTASQPAETPTNIPQPSAGFRTLPQNTEEFGKVPNLAERKENHTLTVRETARMFETAGVARTERSIINWCQPNRQGITRLDSYYDPNERKYYITPLSVETAIQEEIQRAEKTTARPTPSTSGSMSNLSGTSRPSRQNSMPRGSAWRHSRSCMKRSVHGLRGTSCAWMPSS